MAIRQFILTQAKARIESGQDYYICFAVANLAQQYPQHAGVCDAIAREIDAGLVSASTSASLPHYVLEELRRVTGERFPQPYYAAWGHDTNLAGLMRMAWLDRLIEQEDDNVPRTL